MAMGTSLIGCPPDPSNSGANAFRSGNRERSSENAATGMPRTVGKVEECTACGRSRTLLS